MNTRIDHDAAATGDAYVIRIEDADGYRLTFGITESDLAKSDLPLRDRLEATAAGLIVGFLIATGKPCGVRDGEVLRLEQCPDGELRPIEEKS